MFKTSDPNHLNFVPIRNWICSGPGKLVIGGTKYKSELMAVRSILSCILELERQGKVIRVCDVDVDSDETIVKKIEPANNFDDPHLVALIRLTGCKLICIIDPRAHKFLRSPRFYSSPKNRPSLYTRSKNSTLLTIKNIGRCCHK